MDFESDKLLEKALKELNYEISTDIIRKKIELNMDNQNRTLKITATYNNPQIAYDMANKLLELYIKEKSLDFTNAYDNLINKLDSQIADIKKSIDDLSFEAEDYVININKKLYEELEKSDYSGNFFGINYVSPQIQSKLNFNYNLYNTMEDIRQNIKLNKDFSINRIEVLKKRSLSNVPYNVNYKRYILITLFLAFFIGLVVLFIANFMKNNKI